MGALHRKLHEQRGASMLMALFLLLVALKLLLQKILSM